ncbi:MAG TPA: hypothetical protein VKU91_10080, partial [Acidimicrobiales bacterium]|nr:hypothetical protein [Acidimicrobiales bacterium]
GSGGVAGAGVLPTTTSTPPTTPPGNPPPPPPTHCQNEQFPAAGTPNPPPPGTPARPYLLPFTGGVTGATVKLYNPGATLGLYLYGVDSKLCGLIALPSQHGDIIPNPQGTVGPNGRDVYYNNNITFNAGQLAIDVAGIPTNILTVEQAYIAGEGTLGAQIEPTPAANGGLEVDFYLNAKFTSVLSPAALASFLQPPLSTLFSQVQSGSECTLVGGNLVDDGVPAADIPSLLPPQYQSYATQPVDLTTGTSQAAPGQINAPATGQPVTGPITAGVATLVANNFPTAAIDANTTPAPAAPAQNGSTVTGCGPPAPGLPSMASTLNQLLKLPAPPGAAEFYSPSTFAIEQQQ